MGYAQALKDKNIPVQEELIGYMDMKKVDIPFRQVIS